MSDLVSQKKSINQKMKDYILNYIKIKEPEQQTGTKQHNVPSSQSNIKPQRNEIFKTESNQEVQDVQKLSRGKISEQEEVQPVVQIKKIGGRPRRKSGQKQIQKNERAQNTRRSRELVEDIHYQDSHFQAFQESQTYEPSSPQLHLRKKPGRKAKQVHAKVIQDKQARQAEKEMFNYQEEQEVKPKRRIGRPLRSQLSKNNMKMMSQINKNYDVPYEKKGRRGKKARKTVFSNKKPTHQVEIQRNLMFKEIEVNEQNPRMIPERLASQQKKMLDVQFYSPVENLAPVSISVPVKMSQVPVVEKRPRSIQILQIKLKNGIVNYLVESESGIKWVIKSELMADHSLQLVNFYQGKIMSQYQRYPTQNHTQSLLIKIE